MKISLFSVIFLLASLSSAAEMQTKVPNGTRADLKYKFAVLTKKATINELKSFNGDLNCVRYDQGLHHEFTVNVKAKLIVGGESAELSFEGNQNRFTLVDRVAEMQAINTVLIGKSKWDIFMSVRTTDDGHLLINAGTIETTTDKTTFTDGVTYVCK